MGKQGVEGKQILIVEDEYLFAMELAEELTLAGAKVTDRSFVLSAAASARSPSLPLLKRRSSKPPTARPFARPASPAEPMVDRDTRTAGRK